MKRLLLVVVVGIVVSLFLAQESVDFDTPEFTPKNIIVLISSGSGYNHIRAANFYLLGQGGFQAYEEWPIRYAMSTFHAKNDFVANVHGAVNELADFSPDYQSGAAYGASGYVELRATDSGAAATAMACGEKTALCAVGVNYRGQAVTNLCEVAIRSQKTAGVVSSVPFAHATSASFCAHNVNRENYSDIAIEMLGSELSVLMGCGHPAFDDNGVARLPVEADGHYNWVGGKTVWDQLEAGNTDWTLVQSKTDFEAIASGSQVAPGRLLGVPQVHQTLQCKRTNEGSTQIFGGLNSNVPSLGTMAVAALQKLSADEDGFFLMVEGGGVDWASQDRNLSRIIEEQANFNAMVDAVVVWIETNSSWNETLVIVTGNHETGNLTGPDYGSDDDRLIDDYPVVFTSVGTLPTARFFVDSPTNQLIPFFAKGAGAEVFNLFANRQDFVRGAFIDNTDVGYGCMKLWEEERSIPVVKNIFLFIGDGMGYNHIRSANLWSGTTPEFQSWNSFPMSTYNVKYDYIEGQMDAVDEADDYRVSYQPSRAWSDLDYVGARVTDSGSAATAMATGVKTARYAIGVDKNGQPMKNLCERAIESGKLAGVVSSVQFSQATPASFVTHNPFRENYAEIARGMLGSNLAVIMGGGNPDFNNDGEVETGEKEYMYIGGSAEIWNALKAGNTVLTAGLNVTDMDRDGRPDPWTLIESKSDFERLVNGNTPLRVLGVPQVLLTLQQRRAFAEGDDSEGRDEVAFSTPFIQNVPTLPIMTRAAINVLDNSENGFFLMVEGGAVDWASHSNQLGRVIEEQTDFHNAIQEAIDWVNSNSNWSESMIIVTADHETGYLVGGDYGNNNEIIFEDHPIGDRGAGQMPDAKFLRYGHTNQLVPLYVKGAGERLFEESAVRTDYYRGGFVDNTDVADVVLDLWSHLADEVISVDFSQVITNAAGDPVQVSEVIVTPNPASNEISISAEMGDFVQIVDMDGKEVLALKVYDTHLNIDISFLHQGLYIVKRTTEKQTISGKMVIR